ncbi:membrane protein [Mycobacterium phage Reindeer]|uniref:Membrane protein n=1 Tax=Mycobacterium phage Reindeer TaxID=2762283 RepID=A0A7G8LHT9_9CAUD|nr:membrane protein [Mycobacterium phage Reindeer]QNJ56811.1 membrane protein [Mycobacterium phage Reindeer]
MRTKLFALIAAPIAATAAIALAPTAEARTAMYRVGVDITPGDYMYKVVGWEEGAWALCPNPNCETPIQNEIVVGEGSTGYMTVTPNAKYVKTTYLTLTPA